MAVERIQEDTSIMKNLPIHLIHLFTVIFYIFVSKSTGKIWCKKDYRHINFLGKEAEIPIL